MKITMAAAAFAAGRSRQHASKLRQQGRLVTDADGLVDAQHADATLKSRRPGRPVKPVPGAADGMTMAEALRRKEAALAGIRELELSKLKGELLPAADVQSASEAIYLALRDRFRSIPMTIAPLVVEAAHAPSAEVAVHKLMLDAIDEALTDFANATLVCVDEDGTEIEVRAGKAKPGAWPTKF